MAKPECIGQASLIRIADALNVPVKSFFTDNSSRELDIGADECLRLWSEIKTGEGRRQALEALRAIAALDAMPSK